MPAIEQVLKIVDQVTAPALQAVASTKTLDAQMTALERTLRNLQGKLAISTALGDTAKQDKIAQQMRSINGLIKEIAPAHQAAKAAADAQSAAVKAAVQQEKDLLKAAKDIDKVHRAWKPPAAIVPKSTAEQAKTVASAFEGIGGAVGSLGSPTAMLQSAAGALSALGPDGMAAAAGITLVGTAAIAAAAGVSALIVKGFELASQAGEFRKGTERAYSAILGTAVEGKELYEQIEAIGETIPVSFEKLHNLTRELLVNSVPQGQMEDIVRAISLTEKTLGKGGAEAASKLQNVIEKASQTGALKITGREIRGTGLTLDALSETLAKSLGKTPATIREMLKQGEIAAGVGTQAIADTLNAKFAGMKGAGLLSLSFLTERLRENFVKLFEGVNMEPLMTGLKGIVDICSSASASGKAMQTIINAVFGTLGAQAGAVLPSVQMMILQAISTGLDFVIWIYPAISGLQRLNKWIGDTVGWINVLKIVGYPTLAALAGVMIILAGVGVTLAVVGGMIAATFAAIGGAVWAAIAGIVWLVNSAPGLAAGLIDGLVNGITGGIGRVVGAIKNLGGAAIDTLRTVFKWHSPSELTRQLGADLDEGMSLGVRDNSGAITDAWSAANQLGSVRGSGGSAGGSSAGKTTSITFGAGAVIMTINGVADADQLKSLLPSILTQGFEQLCLESGL